MYRTLLLTAGLGLVAGAAIAEPHVVRFDQDAPFNPANDHVDLLDEDATAPDIRLSYFVYDPGGGSNAAVFYPEIIGAGWDLHGGVGLEVESTIGPGATSGNGTGFIYEFHYDELVAGDSSGSATAGAWGIALEDVYYGAGPDNYPLEIIVYEQFPFQDTCLNCSYVAGTRHADGLVLSCKPGVKYIALRWEDGGATYYGWAAFELEFLDYPAGCSSQDPDFCDNVDFESIKKVGLRYVAAGWESDPGTSITIGGGLCPADINFDAQVDFFDVSDYLALYNAGDLGADMDGNAVLNFFDVSEFIGGFSDGCTQ